MERQVSQGGSGADEVRQGHEDLGLLLHNRPSIFKAVQLLQTGCRARSLLGSHRFCSATDETVLVAPHWTAALPSVPIPAQNGRQLWQNVKEPLGKVSTRIGRIKFDSAFLNFGFGGIAPVQPTCIPLLHNHRGWRPNY